MPDSFVSDADINTIENGTLLLVYIKLQYCEKKIVKTLLLAFFLIPWLMFGRSREDLLCITFRLPLTTYPAVHKAFKLNMTWNGQTGY